MGSFCPQHMQSIISHKTFVVAASGGAEWAVKNHVALPNPTHPSPNFRVSVSFATRSLKFRHSSNPIASNKSYHQNAAYHIFHLHRGSYVRFASGCFLASTARSWCSGRLFSCTGWSQCDGLHCRRSCSGQCGSGVAVKHWACQCRFHLCKYSECRNGRHCLLLWSCSWCWCWHCCAGRIR